MNNPITESLHFDELIRLALKEDISNEDISTNAVMPEYKKGTVDLLAKQNGVICGLNVFARTFTILDPATKVELYKTDGGEVKNGELIAKVTGDIRVLLSGERTALNYLQRMSGIATYTRRVVKLLEGCKTRLLDTRKTTPNMRIFEKYAVKVGGGVNHRYNLSDGILLKDNHIGAAGSVKKAVQMAREYAPFVRKIEVEVENLDMCREALEAGADIIMLDNMSVSDMKKAVEMIGGRALTECSGNVTEENIENIKSTGVRLCFERRADAFGAYTRFIAQKSSSCFRIIFTSQYCVALALCLGHLLLCKLPSVKCARSLPCSQLLSVNAPRAYTAARKPCLKRLLF